MPAVWEQFGLTDVITRPGFERYLSAPKGALIRRFRALSVKHSFRISAKKHQVKTVVIASHYDCAGNPVDLEVQERQLRQSAAAILSWGWFDVVHIWMVDGEWTIKKIATVTAIDELPLAA
jgi:hypothetical protein